jgi:hypothetical protein
MKCRTAEKYLPLLAGGDLGPRRARRIMAHLASCPRCRAELTGLATTLAEVRDIAVKGAPPDWSEAEWQGVMARVAEQGRPKPAHAAGLRLSPAWAAVAAGVILAALIFVFREQVLERKGSSSEAPATVVDRRPPQAPEVPGRGLRPAEEREPNVLETAPGVPPRAEAGRGTLRAEQAETGAAVIAPGGPKSAAPLPAGGQDVLSVTLVTKDSGLQVVWFFDKNFEWKGDTN